PGAAPAGEGRRPHRRVPSLGQAVLLGPQGQRRPPSAGPVAGVTALSRDGVVDVALRMVEDDGVERLSMRKLAAELGVAVTAIYWHVGNRDALLEALVDREIAEMGALRPSGRTPEARLVSIARALHRKLRARP